VQRQQMPQRVDCQVQLGALLPLGTVIARPRAAFRRRAQGPAVQNSNTLLRLSPSGQPQYGSKVLGQRLEAPCRQPALRPLVHRSPRRRVIGQPAPGCAGLHHAAQPVEHLAQRMLALPSLLRQERQIGRDQQPFFIRHIGWLRLAGSHAAQPDRYQARGS
jgi:hypothetical protein